MALGWFIVGVVVFALGYLVIFKFQDFMFVLTLVKKNTFLIISLLVILFFTFSFYHIYTTNDIDLKSFEGVRSYGRLYWVWFKSLFSNIGDITGYAVKQDWFLNSTNSTG